MIQEIRLTISIGDKSLSNLVQSFPLDYISDFECPNCENDDLRGFTVENKNLPTGTGDKDTVCYCWDCNDFVTPIRINFT